MYKEFNKAKRLEEGDTIGLVSPSEPMLYSERLERGIKELELMGFKCELGKHSRESLGYMAGCDEDRAEDINYMFRNPSIKGIITTTGGSCANRILPLLDYENIGKNPKIFLGISDISVLINAIHKKSNLVTFHGPYVLHGICGMSDYNREYFKKALTTSEPIGVVREFAPRKILKEGAASGRLVGGNLSSIRSLIGTSYEPDWQDKILFWEEYTTEPHDIDRILMHLKLIGALEKIKGMVIGNLSMCKEVKYKDCDIKLEEMIRDHCTGFDFPIMSNLDFGHNCQNATLPLGVMATINTYQRKFSME